MENKFNTLTERNILFFVGGSILSVYILNILSKVFFFLTIPRSGALDFCVYCTNPFPLSGIIAVSQFVLVPTFLVLLFFRRNLIYSSTFTFISASGYGYWIFESFKGRKLYELNDLTNATFFSYLMVDSSIFDFALFSGTTILLMFQSFLLLRFLVEKVQSKMTLSP